MLSARRSIAASSIRTALIAVLALTVLLTLPACTPPDDEGYGYIDSDLAFEYRSNAELGPIQPRWHLVRVARRVDDPNLLVHVVEVPPEDAGQLMMLSDRERARRIAEVACPKADAEIWEQLSDGHDIEVDMQSDNGLFETIGCRSLIF